MPDTQNKYYPALSDIMKADDLPDFLSFIKEGIQNIFSKIYYKDYQVSKSTSGSSAFYSLDVVSRTKLAFELPGTGINFVLNPDYEDNTISSFPITVFWQWEIMRYVRYFNLNGFTFSLEDFYNLALEILGISEEQAFQLVIDTFVVSSDSGISKFDQLVEDINLLYGTSIAIDTSSSNRIQELIVQVELINKKVFPTVFTLYLLDNDLETAKTKLNTFFSAFVPNDIESYIKNLITPKARVTLELSAAIEFPRKVLVPWNNEGTAPDPDENMLARFQFANALLYADTQAGVGYNLEFAGTLYPRYCSIGKTGLLIQIENLKLDLSKKTNILEADADGRPSDFTGVYARAISVTLPSKWFHSDNEPPSNTSTTLRLGAYDLLVGTGGISGTIMLETVSVKTDPSIPFEYFNDKFAFNYPVALFEKSTDDVVIERVFQDYTSLKAYLQTLYVAGKQFPFQFPLSLTTVASLPIDAANDIYPSRTYAFNSAKDYQLFLANFQGENDALYVKIGGDNGFKIGFKKFDLTFKQNKIIESNISGVIQIAKFTHTDGNPVRIGLDGHIQENGDFNLTASSLGQDFDLKLKDIFTYSLRTVELGREHKGDDAEFYLGTSGKLKFGNVPILEKLKEIDINRLRIYTDGSIEFDGGSIALAEPFVLPLGPVGITVTAIHYGSIQKEVNGVMRKFNYFGFDGGVSIDPLGVEVRGDGVKLYYCVDNLEPKLKPYLHIQTLYVDLTIPASTPVVVINGWLSIPEPGKSPEYAGGIKLQIPKAKIAGGADMRLAPKDPAFIIDAEIELPVPIPLGSFAIYGFRGLIGYRYVAEKEAIGLVSGVNTWYEYYKAPPMGIHVKKFRRPSATAKHKNPVSIGAGATLGTSYDDGYTLSIKAMVLLSIPSLFMIDGKANVLAKRLGLDNAGDPPFFAFIALGDNSLEFGFGADYKLPKESGDIFKLYANVEAGFFFKDSSKWYVNFGTKEKPIEARVLTLITLKSFLMLSARGIEAGARGEFNFKKKYGPVKVAAWAYVEVGGRISFERPQMGSFIAAGVGAKIDVKIIHVYISIDILFGAEATKPFLIYGKFRLCVRVKIGFIKIKFCGNVELVWNFNKTIDRDPINPMIGDPKIKSITEQQAKLKEIVKGVNMLTNDTFDLVYLGESIPTGLDNRIMDTIIPMDTYIDIKSEKGLLPGAIGHIIGGLNNPPTNYTDLIPPQATLKGKTFRQVKHQYVIDDIQIKAWDGVKWVDYHPYKALYPDDNSGVFNNLKIGQWQKVDGKYNTIRLLATTPFSYTEQGEPGWFIPEQYGITSGSLFCEGQEIEKHCANFLDKPLGQKYFCYDSNNHFFYANEAAFMLLNSADDEYAEIVNQTNVFEYDQSLAFENSNTLQIILPAPSYEVELKLTNSYQGVRVKYYSAIIDDTQFEVQFGHPNKSLSTWERKFPHIEIYSVADLQQPIKFSLKDKEGWDAISRVEVEPYFSEATQSQIDLIRDQIAQIEAANWEALMNGGELQSMEELEEELERLSSGKTIIVKERISFYDGDSAYYYLDRGTDYNYFSDWDDVNNTKYEDNEFGFDYIGDSQLIVESDYRIISIFPFYDDKISNREFYFENEQQTRVRVYLDEANANGIENADSAVVFEFTYEKKSNCCETPKKVNEFFNSYVDKTHYYNDILQVGDFIYSVGSVEVVSKGEIGYTDIQGLITKTDTKGNLIWQQNYSDCQEFDTIVKCGENEFYIQASQSIYKIDENSNLIWKKEYDHNKENGELSRVNIFSIENDNLIVAYYRTILASAFPHAGGGGVHTTIYLVKIDKNGDILLQKKVNNDYIISTNLNKIVLTSNKCYFILDSSFNLLNKSLLELYNSENEILKIEAVTINNNNQLYISGQIEPIPVIIDNGGDDGELEMFRSASTFTKTSSEKVFIGTIDLSNNYPKTGKQKIKIIHSSSYFGISKLIANSKSVYLQKADTSVIKFDSELNPIWTKKIEIGHFGLDGSNSRILGVNEDHLFVTAAYQADRSPITTSYIGFLNLNMESCKTVALYDNYFTEDEIIFASGDNIYIEDSYIEIQDSIFVEDVLGFPVLKRQICSQQTNEPNEICNLREQITRNYETVYNQVKPVEGEIEVDYYLGFILQVINQLHDEFSTNDEQISSYINTLNFICYGDPESGSEDIDRERFINEVAPVIEEILDYLNELGQCDCSCEEGNNKTILHSVCWLTREEYEYNVNIPSQGAISQDAFATVAGINKYIQPIWRPDTSYLVHFKMKDIVDNSSTKQYGYTYGFSTAGPVGFFHTHPKATYSDIKRTDNTILDDTTGVVRDATGTILPTREEPHPDKYPLTSLRQYIDYQRSYPNADGNLLSAKPLFYDDDLNTRISLYFSKAYATHFFQNWKEYKPGIGEIKGQMKIVIKDPREDGDTITNPPLLNGIKEDVDIPQTIEEWTEDNNPQVPFVMNQWINMFLHQGNCIFSDKPEVIVPASKYLKVTLKKLKPQKLYTAIVNNIYDLDRNGVLGTEAVQLGPLTVNETQEVHKFVFQTSRYKNFTEQVNSYFLTDGQGEEQVDRDAIFEINTELTDIQLQLFLKTAKQEAVDTLLTMDQRNDLMNNYSHPFDRIIEGILKLTPVNQAISTEVNLIKNSVTGKVIAVLVRNPEPFNNPKMPIEEVLDTIHILRNGQVDADFVTVHSKDYSQVLLVSQNQDVYLPFDMQFKYKVWDGSKYEVTPANTIVIENISNN
jgi:hypothetical protein